MNKQTFLIVDTETTISQTVADFGAVVVDRAGTILDQISVLVEGHFTKLPLFYRPDAIDSALWSKESAKIRRKKYKQMISAGSRSIASVDYVNLWLARAVGSFDPVLTAYNLSFDWGVCQKTQIDLGMFKNRFCLCNATRTFLYPLAKDWLLANGWTTPQKRPACSADAIAHWVLGNDFPKEPHTALEDARDYERPILVRCARGRSLESLIEAGEGNCNWRERA